MRLTGLRVSALKLFPPLSFGMVCLIFIIHLASCGGGIGQTPSPTTPVPSANPGVDVLTYHNDVARTGQNLSETILTISKVNSSTFGKVGFFSVDGKVDAEPLYVSQLTVGGGTRNVLYVATEHDSIYALDADTGSTLWRVTMLGPGETTSDSRNCGQISPEIGVTSTPAIDRTKGPNGAIYVVAMSKDASGNYFQRLHALDLTTGTDLFGGPTTIQASYPGTGANSSGGNVIFDPKQYAERAGLLLLNGIVYTTWTSHCDIGPYTGWVMGFDATNLSQSSVLNLTPNGSEGAIWMSGTAPAADSSGNIYLLDGNGTFDVSLNGSGFPAQGDFGNAFLKLSTTGNGLGVSDYFEMFNQAQENGTDGDLGSGGALVLPDVNDNSGNVWHLAIGAGKDSNIYVVNRDLMGKFTASANNVYQELDGILSGSVFSMPAYFNNTVYYGAVGDHIKAFSISYAKLSTSPIGQTGNSFVYPGATPSVSANGTSNGIVWAVENRDPAVLHAYSAAALPQELYNSDQTGARDQFGPGNKFITPMIVNGKVYVGTTNGVAVFGLLH